MNIGMIFSVHHICLLFACNFHLFDTRKNVGLPCVVPIGPSTQINFLWVRILLEGLGNT